ncbi:uncharacterized protein LOC131062635 [Cryptomeria japonica]|uniref:uncharacterized protein LOC131062635 n=1 Tax=Cryptomeria japonica TaxID=3369 RepID=UPI0025AD34EC|nr:uncharacterized protein LOC131062635 [Cryptomeria japonica]
MTLFKDDEICGEASSFFASVLSTEDNLDVEAQNSLLEAIPSILSEEQNKFLISIPSKDQIKVVVFSFKGNKASGPNGFLMFFFQKFWHIVEKDVSDGVKEYLWARNLIKELNSTFIVLVPKSIGAKPMDCFHPINLCNSFYKIISKVLTLRLLSVLPAIISPQLNDFFLGRQIIDSIITVHENIHSIEVSCKEGFLIKLDLYKAYDRVDWSFFLEFFMLLGFVAEL